MRAQRPQAGRQAGSPLLRPASRPGPLTVDAPTVEGARTRKMGAEGARSAVVAAAALNRRDVRAEGESHGEGGRGGGGGGGERNGG